MNGMLRVAVPNKGTLSEPAAEILSEAGYRRRTDQKDLTVVDPANNVEFFFLRPKDIAIYVGSGQLDFGITGRDLAAESDAPVRERLALGFGSSSFRYAAPAGRDWTVADLAGKRRSAQRALRSRGPRRLLSPVRRSRPPVAAGLHRPRNPPHEPCGGRAADACIRPR